MLVRRDVPVVPNGIDTAWFDTTEQIDFRARHRLPPDRPIVLFVGRLERRKGIHLCPAVVADILRRYPVSFVFAGDDLFGYGARELLPALEAQPLLGSVPPRPVVDHGGAVVHAPGGRRLPAEPVGELPVLLSGGDGRGARDRLFHAGGLPELENRPAGCASRAIRRCRRIHASHRRAAGGSLPARPPGKRRAADGGFRGLPTCIRRLARCGSMTDFGASPVPGRPGAARRIARVVSVSLAARRARFRLARDRRRNERRPPSRERVLATACWTFPIYSQTFVYEELRQMVDGGFDLRFLYTEPEPGASIAERFADLAGRSRRSALVSEPGIDDLSWWRRRHPARVENLIALLRQASGLSRDELLSNRHVIMAFSFARLARAYRPAYLHSYFFYEGTLFTMVAAYLLGVPRGVSCYADHMLDDFPLKLVPLHLRHCDVIVATSHRIAQELRAMHPVPERDNILVKPNAVDAARSPCRSAPTTRGRPVPAGVRLPRGSEKGTARPC